MFCNLATRFYDSVNGHIDSKGKDAKDLSHSLSQHSGSWLSNQKKRQEQTRPSLASGTNNQPLIPSQSQSVARVKQLKPNPGPRIPPPKLLVTKNPATNRKVTKVAISLPTATKKPESLRDYEEPAGEEHDEEYENTSPVRNQ